jgi:hypothetical protein
VSEGQSKQSSREQQRLPDRSNHYGCLLSFLVFATFGGSS